MTKISIAPLARDDLRDIRVYSKSVFGAAAALDYIEGLSRSFKLLLDHSFAGEAEDDLAEGMRSFPHRSHRIYYIPRRNDILIVRVLHHARDSQRALGRTQ